LLAILIYIIMLLRVIYVGILHRKSLLSLFQILYTLLVCSSVLFALSSGIIVIMSLSNKNNIIRQIFRVLFFMAATSGLYLFCWQLYCKLVFVFAGTIHEISKRSKVIIVSSLVVMLIWIILGATLLPFSLLWGLIVSTIMLIIYNGISIYMITLFIKKLFKCVKTFDGNDDKFIRTIVVTIITSITAYSSSFIFESICVAIVLFTKHEQFGYLWINIDGIFTVLSVYFQYNFAYNDYLKCCKPCHNWVSNQLQITKRKASNVEVNKVNSV